MDKREKIVQEGIEKLIPCMVMLGEKSLTRIEYNVLKEVLVNGKKITDLLDTYSLTTHRLKQIFDNGVKRLIMAITEAQLRMNSEENIREELTQSRERIIELEAEIKRYQSPTPKKINPLFSQPIAETTLSGRVKGICAFAGIRNIGQLAVLYKSDFIKIRNCGEQSADETEVFLKSKGLRWGMEI